MILLGEMRDAETIRTAMTAAETGHTVIATLHTNGTTNTIDRIIDAFPCEQQAQVRVQLSMVLRTVVSQQLVQDQKGGQIPVFEIMHTNGAVRSLIREGRTHQLLPTMAASGGEGMITMDQSLLELYRDGRISRETALNCADNLEQMQRRLK